MKNYPFESAIHSVYCKTNYFIDFQGIYWTRVIEKSVKNSSCFFFERWNISSESINSPSQLQNRFHSAFRNIIKNRNSDSIKEAAKTIPLKLLNGRRLMNRTHSWPVGWISSLSLRSLKETGNPHGF